MYTKRDTLILLCGENKIGYSRITKDREKLTENNSKNEVGEGVGGGGV